MIPARLDGPAWQGDKPGMTLDDFDFHLPENLIATRPARPRSSARLLLAEGDQTRDLHVRDLADLLGPGDLLVLNDTKVIPARLSGTITTIAVSESRTRIATRQSRSARLTGRRRATERWTNMPISGFG